MRRSVGVPRVVAAGAQGEDGFITTTGPGMGLGCQRDCCEKPTGEAVVLGLTTETDLESNENADVEVGRWKTSRGGIQVERREEHEPAMFFVFGCRALPRIVGRRAWPSREEPQGNLIGGMATTWRIAAAARVP